MVLNTCRECFCYQFTFPVLLHPCAAVGDEATLQFDSSSFLMILVRNGFLYVGKVLTEQQQQTHNKKVQIDLLFQLVANQSKGKYGKDVNHLVIHSAEKRSFCRTCGKLIILPMERAVIKALSKIF